MEHTDSWDVRLITGAALQPGLSWDNVPGGIAFLSARTVLVTGGSSGQLALIDLTFGEQRRIIDLNQNGMEGSFAADVAADPPRNLAYVADSANHRLAVVDLRSRMVQNSVRIAGAPFTLAFATDRRRLYVAAKAESAGEAGSVSVLDLSDPMAPKVEASIPIGHNPSGMVVAAERVFVSNAGDDSISVIDARSNRTESEIEIRIRGKEMLHGILPAGLAFHEKNKWLLVAEAGINAVGVIDTVSGKVLGHIPAGWMPMRVLVDGDTVFVSNLGGEGPGPTAAGIELGGTISIYSMPTADSLPGSTDFVMQAFGFGGRPERPLHVPEEIRHVVLLVKGKHTFDEVLGDVARTGAAYVMGAPRLAHLGSEGYADGERKRLSLHGVDLTPNHHAIAGQWTLLDNFYGQSRAERNARGWLGGGTPWEALANHLSSHGVSFYKFDEPDLTSDSRRAARFIEEVERRFGGVGGDLPGLLYVSLPGGDLSTADPMHGYPYRESHMVDNDAALGRILEYLSHSKWWQHMAVFVTETGPGEAVDHVDADRIPMLCAGPWIKRGSVVHTNAGLPSLWKAAFAILKLPSLNLEDATAADLNGCYASTPDTAPYRSVDVDHRLFDPQTAQ